MGHIEPKDRNAELTVLGSANVSGKTYWCCVDSSGAPIIESLLTGKRYVVGWDELLIAAIAAGIDTE